MENILQTAFKRLFPSVNKPYSQVKLKGIVHMVHRNKDGEIIKETTGENLITNAGFAAAAGLLGNTWSIAAFTYLATGTDATAAAAGNTALWAENTGSWSDRASATVSRVTTTQTNDTLQLLHTFNFSWSKTVSEVGVLNAASTGILLARYIPTSDTFGNGDSLQITYKIVCA